MSRSITVAELIEELKKCSLDKEVAVIDTKAEPGFRAMKIEDVREGMKGGNYMFIHVSREDDEQVEIDSSEE